MVSHEFQAILDHFWAMRQAQGDSEVSIEAGRAEAEAMADLMPLPDHVKVSSVRAGQVSGILLDQPEARHDRCILYLHGGGYWRGSSRSHQDLGARLGEAARARVLLIDYRRAPEHPFPAAVEDAAAAYRWLLHEFGLPGERITLAGDSAGGGLVVATMLAARDEGLTLPVGGLCISPWVDLEARTYQYRPGFETDPVISLEFLRRAADSYLAGSRARQPLASPVFAELRGIAPLHIEVGGAEVLLEDAVRLTDACRAAGVAVELHVEPAMVHVWPLFGRFPEERAALGRMARFLDERWGTGGT